MSMSFRGLVPSRVIRLLRETYCLMKSGIYRRRQRTSCSQVGSFPRNCVPYRRVPSEIEMQLKRLREIALNADPGV